MAHLLEFYVVKKLVILVKHFQESLHDQLVYLGIIEEETNLDDFVDFVSVFKNRKLFILFF